MIILVAEYSINIQDLILPPPHTLPSSSSLLFQVRTVEDHHRSRIDRLLQENTALRRRLLLKTEEFSQYRSSVERSQRKTLNTFKEKVRYVVSSVVLVNYNYN